MLLVELVVGAVSDDGSELSVEVEVELEVELLVEVEVELEVGGKEVTVELSLGPPRPTERSSNVPMTLWKGALRQGAK